MLASLTKKGLLIAVVLLCCASASYAQSGKTVNTTTVAPTNAVNSDQPSTLTDANYSALGYGACNAKALYEQTFSMSMSEEEFRGKCQSTMTNKQEWINVRDYFQGNADVDLTVVEGIIAAFDAKM